MQHRETEGLSVEFSRRVGSIMDSDALSSGQKAAAVEAIAGDLEERLRTVEAGEKVQRGEKGLGILAQRPPAGKSVASKPAASPATPYVQDFLEGRVTQASGSVGTSQLVQLLEKGGASNDN